MIILVFLVTWEARKWLVWLLVDEIYMMNSTIRFHCPRLQSSCILLDIDSEWSSSTLTGGLQGLSREQSAILSQNRAETPVDFVWCRWDSVRIHEDVSLFLQRSRLDRHSPNQWNRARRATNPQTRTRCLQCVPVASSQLHNFNDQKSN